MDIERQLSEHLTEAAAGVSATPDLAEVEIGARRVRSRRRVATGVAAAMLIAGAGGAGFGLGRGAGRSDDQIVAPAQSDDAETTSEGDATTTTIGGDDTSGQSGPANATEEATAPEPAPPLGSPGTMSRDLKGEAGQMPAYELVLERVTDSGITIRALRGESWYSDEMAIPDSNGWIAPRWCYGDAELRIGLSGPGLIDVTSISWFSELPVDCRGQRHAGRMGRRTAARGHRRTGRRRDHRGGSDIGRGVRSCRAGRRGRGPASAGRRPLHRRLRGRGHRCLGHACPDRGRAEPDEHAGVARGVRAAAAGTARCRRATGRRGGRRGRGARGLRRTVRLDDPVRGEAGGLLDDDTGVAAAIEVARAGDYADAVATAEYTIEDFVFTSPTEAWFRYSISTGTSFFGQRYGTAHLIDGSWRISRGVICQDLALAGAPCEPDPGPIYPASWYDMYGVPPSDDGVHGDRSRRCRLRGGR